MAYQPSDFDLIASMGSDEGIPPELKMALDSMRDFSARSAVANQAARAPDPPSEIKVRTNPKTGQRTVTTTMSAESAEAHLRDSQNWREALGGMQQEMQRMEARARYEEERARAQPPWVQLATALSANLAQARDMPGWVQALGRTAAQLNPRPELLEARRRGIIEQEAGIVGKGAVLGMEAERLGLEQTREQRLTRESEIQQRAKFQSEHINAAIRGEGDPAATTALGVQMGLVKPEQAEAFQKNIEAMKASYFQKKDSDEKLRMAREVQVAMVKAGIDEEKQVRLFAQQDKIVSARINATAAENDKKIAAAEAKGQAKKTELKDFEVKELEKYNAAEQALKEVEALLKTKEAQEIMGPYTGTAARVGAKFAPSLADPKGVIAGMDSKLKLQTALAIQSTGAGARGFGPMERPFFEKLAEGITNTPAQNQRIIETWRQYLDQNRRGVLSNHTDETLQKYPKMFGPRLAPQGASTDDPLGIR